MSKTQDMLGKIRAILDSAEGQEFSANQYLKAGDTEHYEEFMNGAAVQRAMAERLMNKFRIAQEDILAVDPQSESPILRTVTLLTGENTTSEYRDSYLHLYTVIARHTGVRVHLEWVYPGQGAYQIAAQTVGYELDIDYTEMLFTTARMVFSERLEPKVISNLSDQENVYRLRSAGIERIRVAQLVWGNTDRANLGRVGRMYKAECAKRGEQPALDGRGVTGKAYREQYAAEFVYALSDRLRRSRDAAGESGGALVLHGRQERVDEAFYERFPSYRPTPALPAGTCADCEKTKHPSGKCKLHRPRPVTKRDIAAFNRHNSVAAQRGREAGTAAARAVELNRGRTGKLEDGGRGSAERMVRGEL